MSCNCKAESSDEDCWSYSCCSEDSYPVVPKPRPISSQPNVESVPETGSSISRPIGAFMKPPTIEVCTRQECLIFPPDDVCHEDCEEFLENIVKEGGEKAKKVCQKAPLVAGCNEDFGDDDMSIEDEEEYIPHSQPEETEIFCGGDMDVEMRCKQPVESTLQVVQFIFHWNSLRADLGKPAVKEHPALTKIAQAYLEVDPNAASPNADDVYFDKEKYGFETILEGVAFYCYPELPSVKWVTGSGSSNALESNTEQVVKNKIGPWLDADVKDIGLHIRISGSLFYYILFLATNNSNCYYQAH